MATSSPAAQGWDITQPQDVANRPLGSERTLELRDFPVKSERDIHVLPRREGATHSLASAFDQVRTKRETPFLEFLCGNLTPEQSKQRAALLLDNRDLLRNVQGLAPEDQTRFIDKVDQVRKSHLIRFSHVHLSFLPQRRTRLRTREL